MKKHTGILLVISILIIAFSPLSAGAQNWNQMGLDIDGEAAGDFSGGSIALSSDGLTVAISARNNNGNGYDAGHVRIYHWNGANWVQKGTDIDGEAPEDNSGKSVALSSDGNTVAIGAMRNDGNDTDAGHVRIYTAESMEIIETNEPLVYPNPTNGEFTIDLGDNYKSITVTLTDLNGKLIKSKVYEDSQLLNLKLEEASGVYLLMLKSGNKEALIKLVKE